MSNPAFKFDHAHIISKDPEASANWYVEMFGATIAANTMARGAPQIFVDLGGMTILVRGQRPRPARTPLRRARALRGSLAHSGLPHPGRVRVAQRVWRDPRRSDTGAAASSGE